MMAYNFNSLQQQFQDLTRQYQQLTAQPTQQPVLQPVSQPSQFQIPTPPRQVQYVEGMAGARLYQENMQANSSEIIMDREENIFYHVSKDANGTPSKHIIRARFTIEDLPEEEPMFLTRKDFDDFKDEIRKILSENSQPKQVVLSSGKPITQGDTK